MKTPQILFARQLDQPLLNVRKTDSHLAIALVKIVVDFEPQPLYNEASRAEKSMYDKIASIMNAYYGSSDMDSGLVEDYLRYGNTAFLSNEEVILIEELLDRYL